MNHNVSSLLLFGSKELQFTICIQNSSVRQKRRGREIREEKIYGRVNGEKVIKKMDIIFNTKR